ncbi:hypothetical protein CYLTODRAFT_441234 [Cylindrobasidium torrendii FP15055 ss-10]|uniref:Uncharacterized protein n=1 Tax=Cylindrobasidium torrendii FP15055 ss-10 TaxID=1314674 RepID=A0A0D7BLH9_9AGAR|nr:hypothetical protein CYLTODRAFT_441234 [Cylindrobasidium torrendii FP15055 ss-10]
MAPIRVTLIPGTDPRAPSITSKIENTSSERVKLLKDPNTVTSPMATKTFTIAPASEGTAPSFKGIMVKWAPDILLRNDRPGDFIILQPGESQTVEHSLGKAWNFGEQNTMFTVTGARKSLLAVNPAGDLVTLDAEFTPCTLEVGVRM